ncbi:Serine-threonine/tyrosine-protein kinase [Theobroma cacao]|nr:Serine-threonine/tyrosine-protein kinase [Theobroma cacao]
MGSVIWSLLLVVFLEIYIIAATTDAGDSISYLVWGQRFKEIHYQENSALMSDQVKLLSNSSAAAALKSLMDEWEKAPPSWVGGDPCGDSWVGIGCKDSRVTSITLPSMKLVGRLSGDISTLSELQQVDLSYNNGLTGSLPTSIGNLKKLINLILVGCGFNGPIPDAIGSLSQLRFLSLNSNGFTGRIPPSIGNLSNLYWLDLADNQLEGPIPVSSGSTPGLDMLIHTKHLYAKFLCSLLLFRWFACDGSILLIVMMFSIIHSHFGKNKLSDQIPAQLFSSSMTLIHVLFESNKLTGILPSTLGHVRTLEVVRFDNNSLNGRLPLNINNLTSVHDLFLSNNKLTGPLPNLTQMNSLNTLYLSNNSFDSADVPSWFPALPALTTLMMENTQLRGQIPAIFFELPNLQTVVLKGNQLNGTLDIGQISSNQLQIIDLQNNLITDFNNSVRPYNFDIILVGNPVCDETGTTRSYCNLPPSNSSPLYSTPSQNCLPVPCSSGQISSPLCRCAYPYTGTLNFRGLLFSAFGNSTPYQILEQSLMHFFQSHQLPVDSVSLSDPRMDPNEYFLLNLHAFPYGQESFNRTGISMIAFVFSNQTFKPPDQLFGPYFFRGDKYEHFSDDPANSKKSSIAIKIGAAAGASVLFLLLVLAGIYAYRQKKRAERATKESNPFAHWDPKKSSGSIPQLKGARCFSFEELKKYANNFSEANDIGSGGYGKVYRGTLPTGELIAIKRAQQGSMQGGLEFKTEIELLSRVHHKNVVSLLGFCFERGEQMLIYEYVPNGSLSDSLSGKSGIRMDWTRRLKIALGAARGLAYLHELANPPIIHRDIKSTNILLDERLNAKVADFGLSKPMGDSERGHVTTQVKGTMEILDASMGFAATPKGLEKFVDLAMSCVEESGANRPAMGEVVKEIENIMQLAGMNPNAESASSSATYEEATKGGSLHPYGDDSFAYSGVFPASKIEPQ